MSAVDVYTLRLTGADAEVVRVALVLRAAALEEEAKQFVPLGANLRRHMDTAVGLRRIAEAVHEQTLDYMRQRTY